MRPYILPPFFSYACTHMHTRPYTLHVPSRLFFFFLIFFLNKIKKKNFCPFVQFREHIGFPLTLSAQETYPWYYLFRSVYFLFIALVISHYLFFFLWVSPPLWLPFLPPALLFFFFSRQKRPSHNNSQNSFFFFFFFLYFSRLWQR